jgi:hypothetical protein
MVLVLRNLVLWGWWIVIFCPCVGRLRIFPQQPVYQIDVLGLLLDELSRPLFDFGIVC